MSDIFSFSSFSGAPLNVSVIGASGGIGRAFVGALCKVDAVERVYAFSRSDAVFDAPKVTTGFLDFEDEDSIAAASELAAQDTKIDVVIVASGVLHDGDLRPEKSMRDLNAAMFSKTLLVNTIGPSLVAKHFLKHIHRDSRSVFAALSARVGSIEDNALGGWYSYRASKAALNMVLKTASIEVARRYKHAVIAGLHPGTVDTALSEPFQGNVKEGKLFSPEYSAMQMLRVIDGLTPEQSGRTFAWDGSKLPY